MSKLVLAELALTALAFGQVNVLSVNYDTHQTAANLQETSLAPSMDWSTFGKIGTYPVDGQVYAQPLFVSGVSIGGSKYNVVYVATMNNSIYAFNADAPQSATPLWQVNFGAPVLAGFFNFTDILPSVGILGTPVIDATNQVLYAVADVVPPGSLGAPIFQLHAISLVDGHEMFGGPVQVAVSVPGSGAGSSNGTIAFDATQQLQRPGLMLANGILYVAFGSHADTGNYHGWMLAYDASTLQVRAVFNSSPGGRQSAFWHSGRAPAIGANGNVLAVTGNGNWDGTSNFGESIVRLSGADLSLLDWYTPQEWSSLNDQDEDLGSTGALAIPGTNFLLAGGKSGLLYLVNYESMGHLGADTTSTVQGVQVNPWGMFNLALWNDAAIGPIVYEYDPTGALKAFQIANNQINSTILSEYTIINASVYVGLSISANGAQNGIAWVITGNEDVDGVPGTLHALNATNLSTELWNSDKNSTRDQLGAFAKFVGPTVVNGRVFVPTLSDSVVVYGPLSSVSGQGTPAISSIVNGGSFLEGAVAPGELITILGANLGAESEAQGAVNGDTVTTTVSNVQVVIGGIAAPLLFASSSQINAVVPFGVTGTSTLIQIVYQGHTLASATVAVQPASPAVFSVNGDGGGQGAILNQDGTVNSANNPAPPGSVVAIYATGGGLTTPSSIDGMLTAAPYPAPILPVSVSIDGLPAQITYVGAAPGLVAGVMQINVVVPENAYPARYDQVILTVGDYVSPSAVTVSVQ